MRAIFTRSLRGQGPQSMAEWTDALARLAAVCPNQSRRRPHSTECRRCDETLREVLIASALEDTALPPLYLLDVVIDRLEERSVAA